MAVKDPTTYGYMNRNFSSSGTASAAAFSDCGSDRSGEFQHVPPHVAQRLLLSTTSDDVVQRLITDLDSTSVETQRHAATELRLLAKHIAENRVSIAQAGAVLPLVGLISSLDPDLQEQGVTAILNLSICKENKDLIVSSGAIRPLARALKTGTVAARENAACALLRLAEVEEHRVAIGRSGAIPLLVSLLQFGRLRGKKDAATALYALCSGSTENKSRAVEAGAVKPLLELMADAESGMVDKAAYVLQAVVGEGKGSVVEEGGVPVLVELVEVGTQRQKEIAVDVLLQICEESVSFRVMVGKEGAVPPLVALSQSGSSKAKKKAEALIGLLRQSRNATVRGSV